MVRLKDRVVIKTFGVAGEVFCKDSRGAYVITKLKNGKFYTSGPYRDSELTVVENNNVALQT